METKKIKKHKSNANLQVVFLSKFLCFTWLKYKSQKNGKLKQRLLRGSHVKIGIFYQ